MREKEGTSIWNPPNVIQWNTEKSYLFELEKKHIPILRSILLPQGEQGIVEQVMKKEKWTEAIIKPLIGASAYGAKKVTVESVASEERKLDKHTRWLIQEFYADISKGEYSFVFFNKKFSHAVLKVPQNNDFRVHIDYGGKEIPVHPDSSLIEQAEHIVHTIDDDLLYARVDAIEKNGRLILMELELTEPYLFFDADSNAAERFVEAFNDLFRS